MADEAQLSQALINADKAGDTAAAQMLAAEIQKIRGAAQAKPKAEAYKGTILPFSKDEAGNVKFDSDAGILGPIKRAVMLPGQVIKGEVDPMSDEGLKRSLEMASVISPVSAAMEAGERAIPGVVGNYTREKVAIPTAAELKDAKNAAYKAVRASGVEYTPEAAAALAGQIKDSLHKEGMIAKLGNATEGVHAILDEVLTPPKNAVAVDLNALDVVRKRLNELGNKPGDDTGAKAASIAIKALDQFIDAADPASLMVRAAPATGSTAPTVAGHNFAATDQAFARDAAEQAARTIKDARGNAAAGFRSDAIQGIEDASELRAAAANSGRNIGNTLRQKLVTLLLDDNATRGFTPQEIEAATKIVTGTPAANVTRDVSNLLGGGGGLAQALMASIGAAAGSPFGGVGAAIGAATPMAVGRASRSISNSITQSQATKLAELLRMRSPLYEQRLGEAAIEYSDPAARAAVARALRIGSNPNLQE
jgi:hypothetical protein